jgi:RND family efflux transporter MFP subunit
MSDRHEENDRAGILMRVVVPLVVLVLFAGGAVWLVKTKPAAGRRMPPPQVAVVDVMVASITNSTIQVEVMGEVVPARHVQLRAEVSGRVVDQSPKLIQGGRFRAGELMVVIEPDDYDAAVAHAEAALAQARLNEAIEAQRHAVAVEEWSISGQETTNSVARLVALRIPHLEAARSSTRSAVAALARARRDRERTTVRAPFDCIVLMENVDVGHVATQQGILAEVAGTERAHVSAAVPVGVLPRFAVPAESGSKGAPVSISMQGSRDAVAERSGRVVRLLGDLAQAGRMARVLIEVPDPLAEGQSPLLLGAYVRCVIEGEQLSGVAILPRSVVRDGRRVWVVNAENALEVRELEIAWQTQDEVFVASGVSAGERVVKTQLPAAIPGMALRVIGDESENDSKMSVVAETSEGEAR